MNTQILTAAHAAWSAGASARATRNRYKRYTYGDQWGDIVTDSRGRYMEESELLRRAGRKPLTNNLIRRLVKTVVGRYRNVCAENGRYSDEPGSLDAVNCLAELDARLLEEFLISGMAVQRIVRERRPYGRGVWVENVNPCHFFHNAFRDPRGHDLEMCGMLHSMSLAEVTSRFGGGDAARVRRLENIFASAADSALVSLTGNDSEFYTSADGRCRVIEVWTLDAVPSGKAGAYDFKWRCRWLSPSGDLLASYLSPWRHGSHPFVVKFYPLTDGEVHPFVEDVIDQQRYINRLIVLIDRIMGASAKGVLLFPAEQKMPDISWDDICRRWSSTDGVIPITGRSQFLPQQVTGSTSDVGAHKLLEIELKLFEDCSGVSDALLGRAASGNGGSALYESQIANATIALKDIYDTFSAFTAARDAKAAAL